MTFADKTIVDTVRVLARAFSKGLEAVANELERENPPHNVKVEVVETGVLDKDK